MLKRKNLIMLFIFAIAIMLFCRLETYAKTFVDVMNHFQMGIVDIGIKEYQSLNGQEMEWEDNLTVLPGDSISKIPRIYNYGTDCYVRVKITFRGMGGFSEKNLLGMGDKWIKADDGYYYCQEILKTGKTVDAFSGLEIQRDLSENMAAKTFYIDIDVDAIQSKNFIPDFESASPWGSVEILHCGKEGQYDIGTFRKSDTQSFEIEYQGKTRKLVKNKEDFFTNFPYLMPGDKYSDCIKIVNSDKEKSLNIYFRSEAKDDSELLDKILLRIISEFDGEKREVYYGALRAVNLSEEGLLGVIKKGSEGVFYFEIEVPAELSNKYTISDSYVKWIFSTKPISETQTDSMLKNPITREPVKTGDAGMVEVYVSLIGSSCMLFVIGRVKGKEKSG